MTSKDFSELLERRITLTRKVLDSKSSEYSSADDKLHNFKKCGSMRGKHPSEALQGMLDKHLTSYFDILEGVKEGKQYSRDYLDEKIGDIINYFILQEALFFECGAVKEGVIADIQKRYEYYCQRVGGRNIGNSYIYTPMNIRSFQTILERGDIDDMEIHSFDDYIFGELPNE